MGELGAPEEPEAARVEQEVKRDPDRADTRIARAARSTAAAVRMVRERLSLYPTKPS